MAGKDTDERVEMLPGGFVPGQRDSTQNPMMRAKEVMKTPLPKRFYKDVTISEDDGGYRVLLDGKPIRSPAKNIISVPRLAMAEALQAEWDAQDKEIDPATMPMTRLVNSTIDGVEEAREAILDEIIAYLGNDFLCYPASHPERLVERQKAHWMPVLDWAEGELGGRFVQASGILAVEQSPVMGEALRRHWQSLDRFQLGAAHVLMTLTGSALLPFALWRAFLDEEAVWQAAMVDEDWNIEMWGEDEEATKRRDFRRRDFDAAALVIRAHRS
ncbi:ATP12 family protein [uncultured Cohaesibacter sp.]|uniref:ATP12 family chaperone protein n=1 Tax=uncultured Cohaesibacter sp. TaxID=1002546 RepID=UPI0029C6F358|nr:ATP12 family protein [uncultured Cohaesibacter sp.]